MLCMKSFTGKFIAVLALAVAGSLLVAPSAQAVSATGTIGDASGVRYSSGCRYWPVPYSLSFSPDVASWDVDFTVYRPDGLEADTDYIYSSNDPTAGHLAVFLCSYEDAGLYTVEGKGTAYDADYNETPFTLSGGTFKFRLPKTKTTIRVKSLPKTRMRITVAVKDERPNGFFPTDYADVKLQAFIKGAWVTANGGTGTTDSSGIATWLYKRTVRTKARAVLVDDDFKKSISKVIFVPGR